MTDVERVVQQSGLPNSAFACLRTHHSHLYASKGQMKHCKNMLHGAHAAENTLVLILVALVWSGIVGHLELELILSVSTP